MLSWQLHFKTVSKLWPSFLKASSVLIGCKVWKEEQFYLKVARLPDAHILVCQLTRCVRSL